MAHRIQAFEAQQLLRNGTFDLPRMSKVLESQRVRAINGTTGTARPDSCHQVFVLIDEGTIKKYKSDLVDEIEPAVNELIERAEQGLKALYKKESILQTKVSHIFDDVFLGI